MKAFQPCIHCGRDFYPNQLKHSNLHGGKVCRDCDADHEPVAREYHKHCHDCGKFLRKEEWVRKDDPHKKHGLCGSCFSHYENPWDY